MTPEINIDSEESLKTGRLQLRPKWLEYLDTGVIFMLATGLIGYPVMYGLVDATNPNDTFIGYFILPASILFGAALFYKKLTEKKLTKIDTGLDKKQNRQVAIKFMKIHGYKIITNNSNLLIAVREADIVSWPRQINVLFDTGTIYACVLTLSLKARVPSFFTAKNIIKDLLKFIAKESL